MGYNRGNRGHFASARTTLIVAVFAAIAVWAAVGGRAAADVVFWNSGKPGRISRSFTLRVIYFPTSSLRAGGTNRLLPFCATSFLSAEICCVTLCRQTSSVVRVMSWGTTTGSSSDRFSTTAKASRECPLSFGSFAVDSSSRDTQRIRTSDGSFRWAAENTNALASCSTPGLSWATSTGRGGGMVWVPVNGRPAPKPTAPKPAPKPATGGLTPWQRKQLSHSVCVRGCGGLLTSPARPWPACLGFRQRKQISYAECTEGCLRRL